MSVADTAEGLRLAALEQWMACYPKPPCYCRVVVGDWALDDCCCGVLVVSINQMAWYNPFPFVAMERAPGAGAGLHFAPVKPCIGTLGALATLHIGLCVPVLTDEGQPPDPAAETAAMEDVLSLTECILRGIVCTDEECWVIGTTSFTGSQGGCLLAQTDIRLDGCGDAPRVVTPHG